MSRSVEKDGGWGPFVIERRKGECGALTGGVQLSE